jgi:hypothetical protein
MKTRNKNAKLKKRKTKNKTNVRKMKGGSFFFNLFKGFSTTENKELNEDLKKLSTHKETIRKTMQSMYDTAKDAGEFNKNYTSFTTTINEINKLVIDINNHRSKPAVPANPNPANPNPANPNPVNRNPANSIRSTNPTGATNAVAAGAGLVGAGAAAVVGIKDAKNALMGSP